MKQSVKGRERVRTKEGEMRLEEREVSEREEGEEEGPENAPPPLRRYGAP